MIRKNQHIILIQKLLMLACFSSLFCNVACESDEQTLEHGNEEDNPTPDFYVLPEHESPVHYSGVAIYTANMAKNRSTEVNSEWVIRKSQNVSVYSEIIRSEFNAMHKISFDRIENDGDYLDFVMALHGKLVNRVPVPDAFLNGLTGIRFRAVSYDVPIKLTLEAYTIDGALIESESFEVTQKEMKTFSMSITNQDLHYLSFKISRENQDITNFSEGAIGIDDVYLTNTNSQIFVPPSDDGQFLKWLKTSSLNYFLWNYRSVGGDRGVVLEAADETNIVSLSGIGYAYAAFILAEQQGLISLALAKERILSMLKWQEDQNWNNGSEGVFGFPFHYFDVNGNGLYDYSPEAVSTIDWAMCAAGIRTVKQKYAGDLEIENLCNTLLNRPQWEQSLHSNPNDSYKYGRITKGFSNNGTKNGQVWGDAFSEETEIIYLEVLASGQVNDLDLNRIYREQKNGFYVSWFGSGFTYNWMQLWTGTVEPYKSNSIAAYQVDASTATSKFGETYMGLTACATASGIEDNGFINWNNYVGNQGSSVSGASSDEVIQISPAPYGAALALPFIPSQTMQSLRNYVALGYYHPLLGLPDNIRMKELPGNLNVPVPNWNPYDLNIGALAMAIEQYQQNTIANYYMNDSKVVTALQQLKESF